MCVTLLAFGGLVPVLVERRNDGWSLRATADLDAEAMIAFLDVVASHDGELRDGAWTFGDYREAIKALGGSGVSALVLDENGDDLGRVCHCGLAEFQHDVGSGHEFMDAEEVNGQVSTASDSQKGRPGLVRRPVRGGQDTDDGRDALGSALEEGHMQAVPSDPPKLRPYQEDGVAWIKDMWSRYHSAFLADQTGVGKTAQATAVMSPEAPIVVVCPASVKNTWAQEIAKFRPDLVVHVLEGRGRFSWPQPGHVVVLNPEIFPGRFRGCPKGLIVVSDEAHYFSNNSVRTQRMRVLVREAIKNGGNALALTATPMSNTPQTLWTVCVTFQLAKHVWKTATGESDYDAFCADFGSTFDRWGAITWPEEPPDVDLVRGKISMIMLRRLKVDVLHDLPPIQFQDIPIHLDAKTRGKADEVVQELDAMGLSLEEIVAAENNADRVAALLDERRKSEFSKEVWAEARKRILGLLAEAREAIVRAKMPVVLDFVKDNYESPDEVVVVFSDHRVAVEMFQRRDGWGGILGGTAKGERKRLLDDFREGRLRRLSATTSSVGVGINDLVAANHGVFIDPSWSATVHEQAVGRLWRSGQKSPVLIRSFVADHDLDRRVYAAQRTKATRNEAVFGGAPHE